VLFNSSIFLFGFLPIALAGFYGLGRWANARWAIAWLTIASLFFYAWWDVRNLPLLLVSIGGNFAIHRLMARRRSKALLAGGIALNLAALGYYKYSGFLAATIENALSLGLPIPHIVLPLAISFFTFQQIAYLCDSYDGLVQESNLVDYMAFITFFPHLIAGPITHHKEIIPQFARPGIARPDSQMIAVGATMFLIGLFKKVMIADTIAGYANPVFDAAARGESLTLFEAWGGALAYTLQIYFDFSGYSDMAIGVGLMFGVRLPFNFDSPLKATNIVDYWARWHMTLTRFVTAYIYSPITVRLTRRRLAAGKPLPRRGRMSLGTFLVVVAWPTVLAFLIIGAWHGAGWQFVVFGVLHGVYLTINHGWRALRKTRGWNWNDDASAIALPSMLLTLACVVIGLVFFRSPDLETALGLVEAMFGGTSHSLQSSQLLSHRQVQLTMVLLAIVWLLPNSQEWLRRLPTGLGELRAPGLLERRAASWLQIGWRPSTAFALIVGVLGFLAIAKAISAAPPEFIYFNF
jgi:D-alanyl-lipoteichoic acid acyltransferase DltB (MBOAT superfamily)